MLLREAKQILKKNGYRLVEDTDDWDEADMPAGVSQAERRKMVKRHNSTFEDDFKRQAGGYNDKFYSSLRDYESKYGEALDRDLDAGRALENKILAAKSFNQSPKNDEVVGKIFELLKKSGWKYIGTKMGSGDDHYEDTERWYYFSKPGRYKKGHTGKIKDYELGFSYPPEYNFDKNGKRNKEMSMGYSNNDSNGSMTVESPEEFVEDQNSSYEYYMGKDHKKFYRHSKDDYDEEELARAYEDR